MTQRFAKAEQLLRQALQIRDAVVGKAHPHYANTLTNLAAVLNRQGKYAEAESLYSQSFGIRSRVLGAEHPYVASVLSDLTVLYASTGRESEAIDAIIQSMFINDKLMGQAFSISSEYERMAFLELERVDFLLSLILQHHARKPGDIQRVFDIVLRRKAIAAEALAAQRDAALGGKYPHLEPKLRELSTLRMQIAQMTLAGPGGEGLETHQKLLAEWNTQREKLEQELARQIPEMNLEERLRAADRQAVAKALPDGAALVEFVRFNVFDFKAVPAHDEKQWKPARYLAFVLLAGDPDNVQMIDLGEAERIDKLIAQFRETITGEAENRDARSGKYPHLEPKLHELSMLRMQIAQMTLAGPGPEGLEMHRKLLAELYAQKEKLEQELAPQIPEMNLEERLGALLFDSLTPALRGRKRLFLAPDGDLTRLPFEVLPLGDGRRLIDEYHISYLSTGRDVLRFGQKSSGKPTASIIAADPDFDLGVQSKSSVASQQSPVSKPTAAPQSKPGLMSKLFGRQSDTTPTTPQSPKPQHQPLPAPRPPTPVPFFRLSRDLDRAHLHFNRLPGTRAEGEQIGGMLGVIKPWFEGDALESSIKQLRSPRILHLATHGFFLQDQERDLNKERGFGLFDWQSEGGMRRLGGPGMENPLLRSGLALAGANTWLNKGDVPVAAEDGLLTAEDVSGLDLLATELVVLSACDTGLGEIRTGEGVFGLRRAFVLAGAKTLVMSLWKVPDQQTQELMVEFYQRLRDGEPRAEALRNAQLAMKEKYPHPRWWGAFICQGEPGKLEVK